MNLYGKKNASPESFPNPHVIEPHFVLRTLKKCCRNFKICVHRLAVGNMHIFTFKREEYDIGFDKNNTSACHAAFFDIVVLEVLG